MSARRWLSWCVVMGVVAGCPRGQLAPAASALCDASFEGQRLTTPDGVSLWFKRLAGTTSAGDTLLFLHGGPGHHSLEFERAMEGALGPTLIVMDQRGCGRSRLSPGSERSMAATGDDIARVLDATGTRSAVLVAHSFGASVAVAFTRAHPERVRGIVFVDTNADTQAAFTHQLATLAAEPAFEAHHPALRRLVSADGPLYARLIEAYQLVGVEAAQRRLQWHDEPARQATRMLRAETPLGQCSDGSVVAAYQQEGYLDGSRAAELGAKLPVPAVVFAGRHSDTIGPSLVPDAAGWGARVVWFEASAHFPFLEERARFVEALEGFVASLTPEGRPAP